MADCGKCRYRGRQRNFASETKCAFRRDDQRFTYDNWQCETMNEIRRLLQPRGWEEGQQACSGDENMVLIPDNEGGFYLVGWYKNRGRTQQLLYLNEDAVRELDVHDARTLIALLEDRDG